MQTFVLLFAIIFRFGTVFVVIENELLCAEMADGVSSALFWCEKVSRIYTATNYRFNKYCPDRRDQFNIMTDPIADYLTRLRNAIKAGHRVVEVPASNLKKEITRILFEKGYILSYKFVEDGPQGTIKIALKYDPVNKVNAIKSLTRVSTPGLRKYVGYREMPRVLNGLGIAILSTSKGVMTNKEALGQKLGGEVICYVY